MAARKRQLALPLPAPPSDRRKRAKRNWSTDEFYRALARNGLMPVHGGVRFADMSGRVFDGVYRRDPIRLHRRATLARIIKARLQESG